MLKISRVYFDGCGYQDGVLEEIVLNALDEGGNALPHVLHAPNGVGKTTILALLFNVFEPDRRKFLRTEINPQHCLEHYFLPGRLGVVAIELVRELPNRAVTRYVVGQTFWMTPASKGEDGAPGQRRSFAFESQGELTFDSLPFRRLCGGTVLKNMEDVLRWIRQMRQTHSATFFSPPSQTEWAKYLTIEIGVDLRLITVQRKFCAAEGGISSAFLNFKNESEFLGKIFHYMIPPETSESVIASLEASLEKIRDLPKRRDQRRALEELRDAFEPFVREAAALEAADSTHQAGLRSLGALYARLCRERASLETQRQELDLEIAAIGSNLDREKRRDSRLEGEILFLDNASAEKRVAEAKATLERAHENLRLATRRARSARAAQIQRDLASAEALRDKLQAELDHIEQDLAPDRARLGRAGADIHALLERFAIEAMFDAQSETAQAQSAEQEAARQIALEREATAGKVSEAAVISRLEEQVEQHRRERAELEAQGILRKDEATNVASERFQRQHREHQDLDAEAELRDEDLQHQAQATQGVREGAERDARSSEAERDRLSERVRDGEQLETAILGCEKLPAILAGDAKDPYRGDLADRVRGARRVLEESLGRESAERERLAGELKFLEEAGVSAVPQDVREVANALVEAGFPDALPAEHYLAEFIPDAERSHALIRSDPARFTGVFVSKPDLDVLARLSRESRLRLKSPVMVSGTTLEPFSTVPAVGNVVFGPLSAARFNKVAAEQERTQLSELLNRRDQRLHELCSEVDGLTELEANVRRLQREFGARRPSELAQDRDAAEHERASAVHAREEARVTLERIKDERTQLKQLRAQYANTLERLTSERQMLQSFAHRYGSIELTGQRLREARERFAQHEATVSAAQLAIVAANERVKEHTSAATRLNVQAEGWRKQKQHYPETDGQPATPIGTLDDLVLIYKTAERSLQSKRDAQSAGVSLQLEAARTKILQLSPQLEKARGDLSDAEIAVFGDVVDLERAIADAGQSELACQGELFRAENGLLTAGGRAGPVAKRLNEAAERGVWPVPLPEFRHSSPDECDMARASREQARAQCLAEIAALSAKEGELRARDASLCSDASAIAACIDRAFDHLPERYRNELPDLSLQTADLRSTLASLIDQLGAAKAAVDIARKNTDAAFGAARSIVGTEAFRQLEPRVAEHLVRYDVTNAAAQRASLMTRIEERLAIVNSEVENQQRDQNTCLKLLHQHVVHADDLLRRAVRCSRIPDDAYSYAGQRMLKTARSLRDVTQDVALGQLAIWLDEQAMSGRIPSDGAKLAAELVSRVHGGRALGIEILKPKRDAIRPYMPVDSIGLSGGEGVTVAMMLYTIIQKMAVDERTDVRGTNSGGFLLLDNPYGASNLLEHVTLQMSLANVLGIQLFVTTCVEDKNVLNLFPTISRLVQAEKVHRNGVPQYVRVRSADFVVKDASDAA